MRKIPILYVALMIMVLSIIAVLFVRNQKKTSCDLIVFLKDELSMDANRVNHYSNGFTTIDLCDGKRLVYRSDLIMKVVEK
jgi:hypothetical protein